MHGTEVRALRKGEHRAAAAVTARALVDSPTSVAIYGEDTVDALAGLYRELAPFFELLPSPQLAALAGDCVIAAAGLAPPGGCIGAFVSGDATEPPGSAMAPVGDPARAHAFWARWAAADPDEAHWHLGPVGVEPGFQGRGLGGAVMREVCAWLDAGSHLAWLETDKQRNVRFYGALGFEVAAHDIVFGVETWYMRREPHR